MLKLPGVRMVQGNILYTDYKEDCTQNPIPYRDFYVNYIPLFPANQVGQSPAYAEGWSETALRKILGSSCAVVKRSQSVLSTPMGYTYPNHKRNCYYGNHTLYHIGTLDPSGIL